MFRISMIASSTNVSKSPSPIECWKIAKCIHVSVESVLVNIALGWGKMCENRLNVFKCLQLY